MGEAAEQDIAFDYLPDPDNPGWMIWGPRGDARFNTLYFPVRVLEEAPGRARVRIVPQRLLTSITGKMHGGATAGFIDIALFAGARGCGISESGFAVTIDMSIQFLAPGEAGQNLDAVVELVRETGRMAFVRGIVEQDFGPVATFMATIRKVNPGRKVSPAR